MSSSFTLSQPKGHILVLQDSGCESRVGDLSLVSQIILPVIFKPGINDPEPGAGRVHFSHGVAAPVPTGSGASRA